MEIKNWKDGYLFEQNGAHMKWVFWPGCGCNGLTLHYSILYPGESFRLHKHDYSADVISVIQGQGKLLLSDNKEVEIKAGQSVYVLPGELHGFKNTGDEAMVTLGSQSPADLDLYRRAEDINL